MRRRSTTGPPRHSPAGQLLAYEQECAAAAAAGKAGAADRLTAARSWRYMLGASGGSPEVGELFLAFARDDAAAALL